MNLELVSRKGEQALQHPPLLFVHGAWHGAWCWQDYFLDYFAALGYDAHALSLRGHGNSPGQGKIRWHSISDYVSDVNRVIDTLPTLPVLIGHSMGGLVVQKLLERRNLPAGVLLASAPPSGVWRVALQLLTRHPLVFLRMNLRMNLYTMVNTPALVREFFFTPATDAATVQRCAERIGNESYRAFMDMLAFNLPRPKRVRTPLLVLGGEQDNIFAPAQVRAAARAYHTRVEIFPGMGHNLMLEAQWRNVALSMHSWLQEQQS